MNVMNDRERIQSVLIDSEIDIAIKYLFIERYSDQVDEFTEHMIEAFEECRKLDKLISKDLSGANVSALLYGAFHTHVVAMKLFIMGLLVPAGNSQRYVLESIATALLVSKPSLGFLKRYMDGKYSTSKSPRDVLRHKEQLGLESSGLEILKREAEFYSKFSHPTLLSSTSLMTLNPAGPKGSVLGGCFDEGKFLIYDKEIASRVSLASIFTNIVYGVRRNYCGTA
ncbi:hypothetical protein KKHLCK_02150 [Candidatus Electrothrix laxa]